MSPVEREWTILAPGPSLKRWTLVERELQFGSKLFCAPGPVVAINLAVVAPLPIDFWACQDPPKKFEQIWSCVDRPHRQAGPIVWCRENNAAAWRDLGYRTWSHPGNEQEFYRIYQPGLIQGNTTSIHLCGLTILTTLARVVGHGAQRVILYGCDMAGEGYAYGADTTGRLPPVWKQRWRQEQRQFDQVLRLWQGKGIIFERR